MHNADEQRLRKREYIAANRDILNAKKREFQKRNQARINVTHQAWTDANREHVNAESRKRYQRIKPEHAQRVKSWKQRNPETWREISRAAKSRRRARLKDCLGSHTGAEWATIVAKQRGRCARCGVKARLEKDHIIPLSRGGSDYAFNLQGLCKPCNGSKQASIEEGAQLGIFDRVAGRASKEHHG
jgi:5-methylcytosine-specific restriction endonuclease McrA